MARPLLSPRYLWHGRFWKQEHDLTIYQLAYGLVRWFGVTALTMAYGTLSMAGDGEP
jgi:hypothetical protein